MISSPAPRESSGILGILSTIRDILRRAVDGTVVPLFVDYTNQRVVIGATSVSSSPAKAEISGGNLKIVSAGNGVILPNSGATRYYLLTVTEVTNDDGSVQPVLGLTIQS